MLEKFKKKNTVKIGLAPTRRNLSRKNFFDKADAKKEKDEIEKMLEEQNIEFVNLDFLNEEGIIHLGLDAERAAQYFMEEKVDAIFAPHCNFGTEDAVARLAKMVGKPLLIWGPRDEAPLEDGSRLRDSQCGLFATSKVLKQFGIPFSYIPNCRLEDEVFRKGFQSFLGAAAVVKVLNGARIGQIGTRPSAFWTVKFNEEELIQKFGIEVVPLEIYDLKVMMNEILEQRYEEVKEVKEEIRVRIQEVEISEREFDEAVAMKLAIFDWAEVEQLSAAGMLCGKAARELFGICPCFAMAELTDDGFPVACETDIHGAITGLMAQAAILGTGSTFIADMTIRHPHNENAELLWHCGVFPYSMKKEGEQAKLNNHYGAGFPGTAQWEIKGGDITLVRFDGADGKYQLLLAEGKGVEGPQNKGTWLWAEFRNWSELETRIIRGPYIHHCTGVYGHAAASLYEACRYIPELCPDAVFPTEQELERYLLS